MNTENEIWKAVTVGNYGNFYHVSNYGRLKRLGRISKTDGHYIPELILSVGLSVKGYKRYNLREKGNKDRSFYMLVRRKHCAHG